MKSAWLYCFPVLFFPNLGFGRATEFGVIELSDLLIIPYISLVWFQADVRRRTLTDKLIPIMLAFLGWALVSTLSIELRYDYPDNHYLYFSLYKLAKFSLYGFAGYLTTKALTDDRIRRAFAGSLIAAGLVVGIGLATVGQKSAQAARDVFEGYKASNAISVMAAILACYLAGVWLRRKGMSLGMRIFVLLSLCALMLGSAISEGRGGWVAGIVGLLYLCYRGGLRREVLALMIGTPVLIALLYGYSPVFRARVDMTLSPEIAQLDPGIGGFDDGGRPDIWKANLGKVFVDSPIWGTGFFHRGGLTNLAFTGSHNFFLQMFLETGIPGGALILVIFYRMWRLAGSFSSRQAGLDLPVKAALVAAIAGGQSGEYFYGGMVLFAVFATCAACGSLPTRAQAHVPTVRFRGADGSVAASNECTKVVNR
jgi:O-antigen ligase